MSHQSSQYDGVKQDESRAVANAVQRRKSGDRDASESLQLMDRRPHGGMASVDQSEMLQRVMQLKDLSAASGQAGTAPVQRMDEDLEEEDLAQRMSSESLGGQAPVQRMDEELEEEELVQRQPNQTGLPDNLKSGMESLSGMSLDHVRVHYNSSKPAAVQAHAYAQGSDIHLASGQERHLPHELGHVVQQARGEVKPTTEVGGMPVNDNPGLESAATEMGNKALSLGG